MAKDSIVFALANPTPEIMPMESGVARVRVDPQVVAQHCHDFIYEGLLLPVPRLEEIPS